MAGAGGNIYAVSSISQPVLQCKAWNTLEVLLVIRHQHTFFLKCGFAFCGGAPVVKRRRRCHDLTKRFQAQVDQRLEKTSQLPAVAERNGIMVPGKIYARREEMRLRSQSITSADHQKRALAC